MMEFWNVPGVKIAIEEEEEEFIPDEGCPFALSDIPNADTQELIYHINEKGHNWLMIAAAHGWTHATRQLLAIGFDPNSCIESTSAMSLAFDARHLDTVYVLLTYNAKFPANFNTESLRHEKLTRFTQMMVKFHEHVADGDTKAIEELARAHPNLRHFYNVDNKSAALVALELGRVDVYKVLAQHYILPASDEEVTDSFKLLGHENVEKIVNLHESLSLPDPESFLSSLTGSCFLGTGIDRFERKQRHYRLKMALEQLNGIPQCGTLLRFVESAGKLRIVFDFTRDHWDVVNHGFKGRFHPTKHVYIGAKKMLNAHIDDQQDIYGVLIRDLCAYALQLQYRNGGKPYKKSDLVMKSEYKKAVSLCEVNKDKEAIIKKAFEEGSDEIDIRADLITLVPQLLVHYSKESKDPNLQLPNIKMHFQWIFSFFNTRVMKDLTESIPKMDVLLKKQQETFNETASDKFWTRRRTKMGAIGGVVAAALLISFLVAFKRHGGEFKRHNIDCGYVKAPNTAGFITGTEVADAYHGQWPWLAPLFIENPGSPGDLKYICGSSIITRWHLLTAAHCVSIPNMALTHKNFFALVGGHDLKDTDIGYLHNMSHLFVHREYDKSTKKFRSLGDIAILRTAERIVFTEFAVPICFPHKNVNVINVTGMVPGYGRFSTVEAHEVTPKYTQLTTISAEKCIFERGAYSEIVSTKSFCAGMSKASPCAGDSGGGFYVRDPRERQYTITGVVSQGLNANECHPEDFVVFVNVIDFVDWIAEKVTVCENGEECVKACELHPCKRKEMCKDKPGGKFTCE